MVEIKVDLNRREKLRRLHTATHIVNYSARQVLGNHVWQNGSNLKPEMGTLDITHYDNLTLDQIFEIEKIANQTVYENKKVSIEELERTEAEKKYGFILYQGGAIPMKKLRIIHVMDSDIEACGGIHMEYTGGIGFIKIVDTQKIQDGVVRLSYVVRDFAEEFIENKQRVLKEASEVFSVDESQLVKTCSKFFNEWKEQKKQIEKLQNQVKSGLVDKLISLKEDEFEIESDVDMPFLMEVFSSILEKKKSFILKTQKFVCATPDKEIKNFKKEINRGKFKVYIL